MRKRQKSGKSSGFVLDHFRFRLNASLKPTTLFLFRFPHLAKGSFNLRNPGLREEVLLSLVPQTGPSPWNEGLSANSFHSAHALFPLPLSPSISCPYGTTYIGSLSLDVCTLFSSGGYCPFAKFWRPSQRRRGTQEELSGTQWNIVGPSGASPSPMTFPFHNFCQLEQSVQTSKKKHGTKEHNWNTVQNTVSLT